MFRICLHDASSDIYISGSLWSSGVWEPALTALLQSALRLYPEAALLDIGANIGYYTLLAATMGHPVVAVEPAPGNLQRLTQGLKVNGFLPEAIPPHPLRVVVVTSPMSDRHRNVSLTTSWDNQGGLAIRHRTPCDDDNPLYRWDNAIHGHRGQIFQTSTIDHIIPLLDYPQVILKIDIGKSHGYILILFTKDS